MEVSQAIKERYSVRKFSDKPVEQDKIMKILEAAKAAPTACNNQPHKVYVLQSEEAVAKANEISPCIYGAPLVFMVCYDLDIAWKSPFIEGMNSGATDASIAIDEMTLEATNQGLGSCWVFKFDPNDAKKAFDLPDNIVAHALLPVGYPADDCEPAPIHFACRPDDEMVVWL